MALSLAETKFECYQEVKHWMTFNYWISLNFPSMSYMQIDRYSCLKTYQMNIFVLLMIKKVSAEDMFSVSALHRAGWSEFGLMYVCVCFVYSCICMRKRYQMNLILHVFWLRNDDFPCFVRLIRDGVGVSATYQFIWTISSIEFSVVWTCERDRIAFSTSLHNIFVAICNSFFSKIQMVLIKEELNIF